ncbi:MAG: hypothetical protein HOQ02_01330 [Lysobacter sp.]|nr:hypothetical protein [Lysobacter sp.]
MGRSEKIANKVTANAIALAATSFASSMYASAMGFVSRVRRGPGGGSTDVRAVRIRQHVAQKLAVRG